MEKIGPRLMEAGASDAEIEFLIDRRVELNAFAADALVAWIEAKLTAAGVQKIVPTPATLHAAARGMVRDDIAALLLRRAEGEIERQVAAMDLTTIETAVYDAIEGNPALPWDDALRRLITTRGDGAEATAGN